MPHAQPERIHILVVDGYAGWRDGVATALRHAGYQVTECRTAAEALAVGLAPGAHFDLLLTEAELRDSTGLALGRQLRRAHRGLRVLFMGYSLASAGPALLSKPFSLLRLERVVSRTLVRPPVRSITQVLSGYFPTCGDPA